MHAPTAAQNGNEYQAVFTNSVGTATTSAATLTISNTTTAQNGSEYEAVFTNSVGTATTSAATLTVNYAPTVTSSPTSQTVNAGVTTSFTATANDGNPTPTTVQWQVNTGSGFTNLSNSGVYGGITTDTLTITGVTPGLNGAQYQAVFSNAAGLSATTTPATLTVDYAPVVTSNPSSVTVNAGQSTTFTAAASGNPTPTTVQWEVSTDGGITFNPIAGATSTTLSITNATAAQNGTEYEAVFTNSVGSVTTSAATLTVDYAPTVTNNPTNLTVNGGQTATFTASASDGNPTPTTVQWQVSTNGGQSFSNIQGATSTTLTLTNTTAAQNGYEYQAVFSNAAGLSATTSAATLTVKTTVATTTNLTSSLSSSVFGQAVTFTATVKPASGTGTPTGSVTFMNGSITLGTAVLSSSGKATLTTKALPAGQDSVTAIYSGNSNFATSTSAALTQNVSQDATTTSTVVSSANPSSFGQMVTMTVTIKATAPGSGVPMGTVTFLDGSTSLGTSTLNSSGIAKFSTTALSVGSHSITASYAGDSNFTASATTTALTQTVNQAATKTTVTSSANPSRFGRPVVFTATVRAVAPGSGVPTGTVTFYDGSTSLGTAQLYGSGQATISIGTLSIGTHSITASYSGDGNFTTSATTTALSQVVNQDTTKTTVVSSANPSLFGLSVTFTATVSANAPGSGTPTGSVTFMDGTTNLGTATLSGGSASFTTTSALAIGSHKITAVYGGDGNFTTSTSAVLNQTVKKADLLSAHNGSTDPTTENFGYSTFGGPAGYVGQATDQGRPTWEITSGSLSAQIYYTDNRPLSASQQAEIASQGFTLTLVARVDRNGVAPAYDQYPAPIGWASVGLGNLRWDIDLGINSKGDTVVNLPTTVGYGSQPGVVVDTGPTYTLSNSGYHTYQLYYSPATNSASLYIDGKLVLTGYTGETAYVGNWRLYWGAQNGGKGFFNTVKLEAGNDIV